MPEPATSADRAHASLVIIDPVQWHHLAPLAITRPVCGLRCGIGTLLQNQVAAHRPAKVVLWVRPSLEGVARRLVRSLDVPAEVNTPLGEAPAVLVDGRTFWFTPAPARPGVLETDETGEPLRLIAAEPGLAPPDVFENTDRWQGLLRRPPTATAARVMRRPWDLVGFNMSALLHDAPAFSVRLGRMRRPNLPFCTHAVNGRLVHIAESAVVQPGVVLDASEGPVCIDHDAVIGANSVLKGPCYIGNGSIVMPLTRLRNGVTLGPLCRVGGEISNAIFQANANKAHDGYVGDSLIGEWVNLGAMTTTSNLKNTYGPVTAATPTGTERTGRQFLGTVFGDHAKCGIGTMLAAGSYVGVGTQLAVPRPPRFTPSFRFVTPERDEAYQLDKLIAVAKTVLARRGITWDDMETHLLHSAAKEAAEVERPSGD